MGNPGKENKTESFEEFWTSDSKNETKAINDNQMFNSVPIETQNDIDLPRLKKNMENLYNAYEKIILFGENNKEISLEDKITLIQKAKIFCIKTFSELSFDGTTNTDTDRIKRWLQPEDIAITPLLDNKGIEISWEGTLPKRDSGYRFWYPFYGYGIQDGLTKALSHYFENREKIRFNPSNRAFVKLVCTYNSSLYFRDYDNLEIREIFNALKAELFDDDSPDNFAFFQDFDIGNKNQINIKIVPFSETTAINSL